MTAATELGKEAALSALKERRDNKPDKVNNASLPPGAPMYFYCMTCGHLADVKPELYLDPPKKLCKECSALKDLGWLE
jgi:hypothetical protein